MFQNIIVVLMYHCHKLLDLVIQNSQNSLKFINQITQNMAHTKNVGTSHKIVHA
jgi:hypothetical protein